MDAELEDMYRKMQNITGDDRLMKPGVYNVKTLEEFTKIMNDKLLWVREALPFADFFVNHGKKFPDLEFLIVMTINADDGVADENGLIEKAHVILDRKDIEVFLTTSIESMVELEEYELCAEMRNLLKKYQNEHRYEKLAQVVDSVRHSKRRRKIDSRA